MKHATDWKVFSTTLSPASGVPYDGWLVDGVAWLVAQLRDCCGALMPGFEPSRANPSRRAGLVEVTIQQGMASPHSGAAEECVEAVRGIPQSITLDYAAVVRYVGSEAGPFAAGPSGGSRIRSTSGRLQCASRS